MSYSDDLDWLARNVHEWKEGKIECIPMSPYKVESVVWSSRSPCEGWITKDQWLARRAELQNKPSWYAAPTWCEWLAQHASGFWCWGQGNPAATDKEWEGVGDDGETQWSGMAGGVLGDWRDTLERRPADMHKTTEEIDTSSERVQKSAESMNDWHERGGLPPVGAKCEYRLSTTSPWYPCEIKYVIHDDGVVMMREDGFEQFCSINSKLQPVSFRPIRSERDEAIEAMKAHCPYPGSWEATYRLFAESLYDAGYRAGCSE